ncbi:Ubiquinol-cytochrome C chaperone-like protein [Elsinoe fawcettii]|nr:Ubiquinol-cytochrome C chaperone-like protein [Elsinoe fawcettii]
MSGRQCYTAIAQGARTRPQALRYQLFTRNEHLRTSRRPFHTSPRTLAQQSSSSQPSDPAPSPTPPPDAPSLQKFASTLRKQGPIGGATAPYAAYGTTESLFKSCSLAGDYSGSAPSSSPDATSPGAPLPSTSPYNKSALPEPLKTSAGEDIFYPATTTTWHYAYSLPPTFSTWSQLTILHLYLLQLRLRMFPAEHERKWTQQLLDHFFYAAEEKMDSMHQITSKGIRSRYLKDMYDTYRGNVLSYDEGIVKGDAVLGAAVWRNVFGGKGDVDAVALAEIVGWVRRCADSLGKMGDEEFVSGKWSFGAPWKGRAQVEREAEGMRQPFVDEGKAGS